jgi:D-amino-acid dehydrogenase
MHVCVLGAGIVGLSTAYQLTQRGIQVTIVDEANRVGAGASGDNGGQLSYSYVQPLADSSIWAQLPKLLLSPHSPLKFRPQWDANQWRWGFAFLKACNRISSERTTASLLGLAALSRGTLDAMRERENITCDYSATGKLVLYSSKPSFADAQKQMQLQQTMGSQQQALDASATVQVEPSLASYQSQIIGSIYTPSECAIDTHALCIALERILRARGVRFELSGEVLGLTVRQNQIVSANTSTQSIEADQFVLALGSASAKVAQTLGVRLPIYPIKGYSVTFDFAQAVRQQAWAAPIINVTDASKKVVFARLGQRLRVAGMAELVGYKTAVDDAAISKLIATALTLFPMLKDCPATQPWAGLRPATPTGMPIVGRQADAPINLTFNTGHGALGLTLAFGTAAQVASLIQA